MKNRKLFGFGLLALGILSLAACILVAFALGTVAVPILLIASIVLNSAGVTVLRGGKYSK